MTQATPFTPPEELKDLHSRAFAQAAEAFLVLHLDRPALRLRSVSLAGGPDYESQVLPEAARLNRTLLEGQGLVLAAQQAAGWLLAEVNQGPAMLPDLQAVETWLRTCLNEDERPEAASYARVLYGRARGLLREHWCAVSVLALGLQQASTLDVHELRQRLKCVDGIRSSLLN